MTNSAIAKFTDAVNAAFPTIAKSLQAIEYAERRRDDELAALRGGSQTFGDEQDIQSTYRSVTDEARRHGSNAAYELRTQLQKIADDTQVVDAGKIAEIAPAVALGLSDGELKSLAKSNRHNRSALAAISRSQGAFAASLGVALDAYDTAVAAAARKCADFPARAVAGTSGVTSASTLRGLLDDQLENIQNSWDDLQAVIDGDTAAISPLEAALKRGAARLRG